MIKNSVCDALATESDNNEDSAVYKLPVKNLVTVQQLRNQNKVTLR